MFLRGKPEDEQPLRVLTDTGASQSLILSNVLPLSESPSCHASTVVQGVPAALYWVHVKSKLVSGFFAVAVMLLPGLRLVNPLAHLH